MTAWRRSVSTSRAAQGSIKKIADPAAVTTRAARLSAHLDLSVCVEQRRPPLPGPRAASERGDGRREINME